MSSGVTPVSINALPAASLPLSPAALLAVYDAGVTKRVAFGDLDLGGDAGPAALPGGPILDDYAVAGQTTWDGALAAAAATIPNGGRVYVGPRTYAFTNLTIPEDVTIEGVYGTAPFPGLNNTLDLDKLYSIRIAAGGTIKFNSGSALKGCFVAPAGMTFPQQNSTSWAGTACTVQGDTFRIQDCLIVGFNKLFQSDTYARGNIIGLNFDCNSGIDLSNNHDTFFIHEHRGWPFASIKAYAASLNTLPAGDPNRSPDGYDSRITARSGIGLKLTNRSDDTQLDGIIMVGFVTGYHFSGTAGIRAGKLWAECYGRSGTRGVYFGPGTENIFIADLQLWSCEKPYVSEMGNGNEVQVGRLWIQNPLDHAIHLSGGNHHFGTGIVRGVPQGKSTISILEADSGRAVNISGLIKDESPSTSPAILLPSNFPASNLRRLLLDSPYRSVDTTMYGGNPMVSKYILTGTVLKLRYDSDVFKISGTTAGGIGQISGGWHGRRVTLVFNITETIFTNSQGGNIAAPDGVTQRACKAGTILEYYYDAEFGSWRELLYTGAAASGGGSTDLKTDAGKLYGAISGTNVSASFSTMSQYLDTIVASPGCLLSRGSSGWVSTNPGTNGQVLTSQGGAGPAYWNTLSSSSAVTSMRQVYAGDLGAAAILSGGNQNVYEPYSGAVVSGLAANNGYLTGGRWRYMQYFINGGWYSASYA